jgi:hypothetical protein
MACPRCDTADNPKNLYLIDAVRNPVAGDAGEPAQLELYVCSNCKNIYAK